MDLKDNWTVIQTTKLITTYKTFPNLWNSNHKYYKNKTLRKNCLRNIAKEVSEIKPGTTINDVRAKLKTLRSQYSKEKRRRELIVRKRGLDQYEPKLWCYDEIKFIDDEMRPEGYNSQDEGMEHIAADDNVLEELLENDSSEEEKKVRRKNVSRFPTWSKEQTFVLLQLLKQNPILYDRTHPFYANNFHRTKAFREVLVVLRKYKPHVTIPEMRAKLKTIRSQYIKEKRMLRESMEHRGRVQYVPKLWCYEHLKFLDERGKFLEKERAKKAERQRMNEESNQERDYVWEQPDDCYVSENENEIYVKSYDDSDAEERPTGPEVVSENSQIPRSILHQKCLSLVESLTKQMRREQVTGRDHSKSGKTPQALLGKMVEVELSKVSETVFEDAKWKIIKLLEEASRKNRDEKLYKCVNGQ